MSIKLVARNEIILDNPNEKQRADVPRIAVSPGEGFTATSVLAGVLLNSEAARKPKEDEVVRMSRHFTGAQAEQQAEQQDDQAPKKALKDMTRAELEAEALARNLTIPDDADTKAKILAFLEASAGTGADDEPSLV